MQNSHELRYKSLPGYEMVSQPCKEEGSTGSTPEGPTR